MWEYLDAVEALDPRTVKSTLSTDPSNPGSVQDAIAGTSVVPNHVWERFGTEVIGEENLQAVGSGPFNLESHDQTQINLVRADSYWAPPISAPRR